MWLIHGADTRSRWAARREMEFLRDGEESLDLTQGHVLQAASRRTMASNIIIS